MHFGASTLFFRERSVKEALEAIVNAGYTAAEVWVEHLWWTGERPADVAARAHSLGLTLSAHAASYDLNIASSNAGIRQESLRQVALSVAMAAEMGVQIIVVHPGRLSSSRDRVEDFWDRLFDAVERIEQWALEHDVRVGLELMERRPREFFMTPEDGERLMSHTWNHVGLTVDIAHLKTLGDPVELLSRVHPAWIAHVHLSDNLPHQTHVPLGQGCIDLRAALSTLGTRYNGLVSLEGYVPGRGEEVVTANLAYLRDLGFA